MENNKELKNQLYPIFLKLDQLRLLLVGAGNVGLEKLESLLANSPRTAVTIVAPMVRDEVRNYLKDFPECQIHERKFEEADLENKDLVILSTDDKELHKRIRVLCKEKRILINVADTPELCDFYLGSIVQKGNLKIAISTNGKSPTAAKRIKQVLNESLPEEIDDVLENLHTFRNTIKGDFQEKVKKMNAVTRGLVDKESLTAMLKRKLKNVYRLLLKNKISI